MPGLVPGIRVLTAFRQEKTWMAGKSSAKTRFALLPGHDEKRSGVCLLSCPPRGNYLRSFRYLAPRQRLD
jgi:hypothetical protein